MRTRAQTTANLERCYDAFEHLIGGLDDEQFAVPSLCPAWDVRGVVTHLGGIEFALSDWRPEGPEVMPPFARVAEFERDVAESSNQALVDQVAAILAGRRKDLASMSDAEFDAMTGTPVGPGTYRRFMDVRVFDFWVHQRDMTTPLGIDTDDGGPTADSTLDEIEASIGYIVGKGIGLPEGRSIRFNVTGPAIRTIDVAVDGRATRVDHLADPDVVLSADTLTFVQLACGRIDPQAAIDRGAVSWSGDDEWGHRAATGLRFTR